jgi:4-hydroxybenzoate polyprenyltransferase
MRPTIVLKSLRVHQWVKNLLIFVPFLLAFKQVELSQAYVLIYAFFAMSLCASASYLFNDLMDVESDREHPTKKNRPIASGAMTKPYAYGLLIVCLVTGVGLSFLLSRDFQIILTAYLVITILYSIVLKSIVLLDVIILGALYTIRIVAGIYAANVAISFWILVFSMFLFVSLAMLKRFSELYNLRLRDEETASGRGYIAKDLELVSSLGSASGFIAVLIIVLYIHDPITLEKYTNPEWLWLILPALLYWISHMWLISHRGKMNEDPVLYAIHDQPSYIVGVICIAAVLLAI